MDVCFILRLVLRLNGIPPVVFYDEWGYPSGMAGGYLYSKYPQHAAKSLEKIERDVTGPAFVKLEIPDGITMGAARMNLDTKKLVDISDSIEGRQLDCEVVQGRWKVMAFYLDPKASLGQGVKSGYVDYLDSEAVHAFIDLNYQAHYDHLKEYWGDVLKITHYDEPAMHVANGKSWTPGYNEAFKKEHGFNPVKYYPALWYDIGPDTAAVRNALWGFRAKLFSESFIKQLDECAAAAPGSSPVNYGQPAGIKEFLQVAAPAVFLPIACSGVTRNEQARCACPG